MIPYLGDYSSPRHLSLRWEARIVGAWNTINYSQPSYYETCGLGITDSWSSLLLMWLVECASSTEVRTYHGAFQHKQNWPLSPSIQDGE